MGYLTVDNLMGFKYPEPLVKDVELLELGGSVRIQGIATREDHKAINEAISGFREAVSLKALTVKHPVTGKACIPDIGDVVAACWIAQCVTEPKMTALQWLQFSAEGFKVLPILFNECLICSREDGDAKTDTPDGLAAAENELKTPPAEGGRAGE